MVSGGHVSGGTVTSTIVTFTVIAGVLTIARLYTRKVIVKTGGIDDLLCSIGLICSVALTVTMCEQVVYGMGQHESALTAHEGVMSLRWFWASIWIYYLALWAVKMNILFQYLRILPEGGYRRACYILMTIVSLWTMWAFFSAVFACTPVNAFWDTSVKGACLNRLAVWFSNAAVNILTDLATTILPLPTLNSLRIPKRQKYILMVVFGLGGITCVLSILRLQSLYVISKSTDVSWDNPLAATWSSLEVNVGIICSCIPTLKGMVSRFFPRLSFGDSHNSMHSRPQRSAAQNEENRASFGRLGYHLPESTTDAEKGAGVETHELSGTTERRSIFGAHSSAARLGSRDRSPFEDPEDAHNRTSRLSVFSRKEHMKPESVRHPSPGFTAKNQEAKEKVRSYVQRRPTDSGSSKPDDLPMFDSDSAKSFDLQRKMDADLDVQEISVSPV